MFDFEKVAVKRITSEVTFMGEKLKISKLTVSEVEEIQKRAKDAKLAESEAGEDEAKTSDGFAVLLHIIRLGAEGASEVSDETFKKMPLEELSSLSEKIMKFSGLSEAGKSK